MSLCDRDIIIGVRDHFRLGGTTFFARISHLCQKSRICLGNAFLPHMGGGGGGGKESSSFGVIEYGTPQRGGCGDVLEIWVLKTRFWVRYKFQININI